MLQWAEDDFARLGGYGDEDEDEDEGGPTGFEEAAARFEEERVASVQADSADSGSHEGDGAEVGAGGTVGMMEGEEAVGLGGAFPLPERGVLSTSSQVYPDLSSDAASEPITEPTSEMTVTEAPGEAAEQEAAEEEAANGEETGDGEGADEQ